VADNAGNNDVDDREIVGRWYASSFDVGHNAFEFKVDCGQEGGDGLMTVFFRVVASPFNARELFRQLGMSLLHYADRFGPIDDNKDDGSAGSNR
jgi:hypothetical protein